MTTWTRWLEIDQMPQDLRPKVEALIGAICAVTDGKDHDAVAQALAFCLIAHIQVKLQLNQREAVDYCARHLHAYGAILANEQRGRE